MATDRHLPTLGARRPPDPRKNVRTALALLSVALVFFIGVFVARLVGTDSGGFTVLGLLIIGFLAFAIGRNLRSRQ